MGLKSKCDRLIHGSGKAGGVTCYDESMECRSSNSRNGVVLGVG